MWEGKVSTPSRYQKEPGQTSCFLCREGGHTRISPHACKFQLRGRSSSGSRWDTQWVCLNKWKTKQHFLKVCTSYFCNKTSWSKAYGKKSSCGLWVLREVHSSSIGSWEVTSSSTDMKHGSNWEMRRSINSQSPAPSDLLLPIRGPGL